MAAKNKTSLKELLYITLGTFIMSIAIGIFLAPNNIVTGGVTGIGITVQELSTRYFGFVIPVWLSNIVINIPLLMVAMKLKGFKFLVKTLYGTVLLSFFLFIIGFLPTIGADMFLSSVYGGVLSGAGLGFVFRGMGTTGGTDLLAVILNNYFKHISFSKFIFYLDSFIVVFGFFIFGYEVAMYAIISIFISSQVIESVLEGIHFSKAAFIISSKPDEIAKEVMNVISRGVTGLQGVGMYTNQDKTILLAVVSVKEIVVLKEIVRNIDENSFVIVADVREVLGEGFKTFV